MGHRTVVRVLFFAQLREQLGVAQIELAIAPRTTLEALRTQLVENHPQWREALYRPNVRIALNQAYANPSALVHAGDEVAFLPPVTGG